jgi:hypothetical protein
MSDDETVLGVTLVVHAVNIDADMLEPLLKNLSMMVSEMSASYITAYKEQLAVDIRQSTTEELVDAGLMTFTGMKEKMNASQRGNYHQGSRTPQ